MQTNSKAAAKPARPTPEASRRGQICRTLSDTHTQIRVRPHGGTIPTYDWIPSVYLLHGDPIHALNIPTCLAAFYKTNFLQPFTMPGWMGLGVVDGDAGADGVGWEPVPFPLPTPTQTYVSAHMLVHVAPTPGFHWTKSRSEIAYSSRMSWHSVSGLTRWKRSHCFIMPACVGRGVVMPLGPVMEVGIGRVTEDDGGLLSAAGDPGVDTTTQYDFPASKMHSPLRTGFCPLPVSPTWLWQMEHVGCS